MVICIKTQYELCHTYLHHIFSVAATCDASVVTTFQGVTQICYLEHGVTLRRVHQGFTDPDSCLAINDKVGILYYTMTMKQSHRWLECRMSLCPDVIYRDHHFVDHPFKLTFLR